MFDRLEDEVKTALENAIDLVGALADETYDAGWNEGYETGYTDCLADHGIEEELLPGEDIVDGNS